MKQSLPQPLIRKVDCVRLYVPDLDAGLAFYRDQLGHELIWRTERAAGLRMPDTDAEIVLQTEDKRQEIDLTVDSAGDAALRIEQAGGKVIVPPFGIPIGRCVVVQDPWGNPLVLLDFSKGMLATDEAGNVIGNVINFYNLQDAYGCFSNFAPYPLTLKSKLWPTSEHYFQAQKFAGTEHKEAVRRAKSPSIAARMGRSHQRPLRPDWEEVKDDIMREAVLAKFTQHADLQKILLGTGDALLVEHTRNDSYWGDGGDGKGKNMLGQILMQVREKLRHTNDE